MLASGNRLVSGKGVGEQGIHAAIVTLPALPCQQVQAASATTWGWLCMAIERDHKNSFQRLIHKRWKL